MSVSAIAPVLGSPAGGNDVVAESPGAPTPCQLLERAQQCLDSSDVHNARRIAVPVLTAARRGRYPRRVLARALTIVAACDLVEDRHGESMEGLLAAIGIWQEIGDRAGEAIARANSARVLLAVGQGEEAVKEGGDALEAADASGDPAARRTALTTLATVCIGVQQFVLAVEYCERAIVIARGLGDEVAAGALLDTMACANLGMAYSAQARGADFDVRGTYGRAVELSREAMLNARRLGHRRYEATALANLAEGMAAVGRADEALRMLQAWRPDPDRDSTAMVTHHLDTRGSIFLALGRYAEAAEMFAQALASAEGPCAAMMYHEHLAEAYELNGEVTRALEHYKAFHALFVRVASDAAQRGASVAAVRWETTQARSQAERERARADALTSTNEELSRRADDLLRESRKDGLTGLANRRALDELLAAGRPDRAVALVDVDRFKQVNDTYSHLVGDEVLRRLGRILEAACRSGDTPARFGGEEFAVVLDDLDGETAWTVAERMRVAVEEHDWSVVAEGLAVTVSIGVAHVEEADGVAGLLALADRNLYYAKQNGRNRAIRSTDLPG